MKLCVALLAAWLACGGGHAGPPPAPPPTGVPAVAIEPTKIVDSSEYLAQLRSRTTPALKPQVEGHVTHIYVHPGDVVDAGAPLMRIDPGGQPAAVAQARATGAGREAALALAERNFGRVQQLVQRGALAGQELDNAREALLAARADVAATSAQIRENQVQLAYYEVVAPTRGVVGDIPVRIGDRVTTSTTLTSVTDNRVLEANISIPVERAKDAVIGTEVHVVDDSGATLGTGQVAFVAPDVNLDTQSVLVKANIDNAAGTLRADQLVRTRVVWSTHEGLAVPASAVTWQGGQSFVFVVDQAHGQTVAHQVPVQLGELADNAYPVLGGLTPGARVINGQLQKLREGAPIAVRG